MIFSFQQIFLNFTKYAEDPNLFYPMAQNVNSAAINNEPEKVSDWLCKHVISKC